MRTNDPRLRTSTQSTRVTSASRPPNLQFLAPDCFVHELMELHVHRKPRERALYAKGYGAFGHFQPYYSMRPYTRARFLQNPAVQTPVLVRFSQFMGQRGSPDTARDVRGFATRFFTNDGVYDLLATHIPVSFVRDPVRFCELLDALSPSPVNNLRDPERFWSFVAKAPETMHMLMWLYSDYGTIGSYRTMRGYGVNTFVWENADGVQRYVRYHLVPFAGEAHLDWETAQALARDDPDVAGRDLFDTLNRQSRVAYELCVQLIEASKPTDFDRLDPTFIWDEQQVPLMKVGRLTLERNPNDYQLQVEQAAFSPANLVDGIAFSRDPLLQARSFVYWDAQRYRLGPDFRKLPINPMARWKPQQSSFSTLEPDSASPADPLSQARARYERFCAVEREHLCQNIARELRLVSSPIQNSVLGCLGQIHPQLQAQIQCAIQQ